MKKPENRAIESHALVYSLTANIAYTGRKFGEANAAMLISRFVIEPDKEPCEEVNPHEQ